MSFRNRVKELRYIRGSELVPNEKNYRAHPKAQREIYQALVSEIGFAGANLAYQLPSGELKLIDGHMRSEIHANEMIPVIVTDLTEAEAEALLSLYDPLSAMAKNAEESLAELANQVTQNFPGLESSLEAMAKQLGLDLSRAVAANGAADQAQIDRAEELLSVYGVERGDLWLIESNTAEGSHRLLCADCTSAETERLEVDDSYYLFSDPPYGIDYDPSYLDSLHKNRKPLSSKNKIANDTGSLDLEFLFSFSNRMIWGFPYIYDARAKGWVVWDKQPGVDKRGVVTPVEMASTTMRAGFDMIRVMWGGYYRASGETSEPHPTQKPIGVIKPFIEAWTERGAQIYDPFAGSGSTLIASELAGRLATVVELEPKYCSVILDRAVRLGLQPRKLS